MVLGYMNKATQKEKHVEDDSEVFEEGIVEHYSLHTRAHVHLHFILTGTYTCRGGLNVIYCSVCSVFRTIKWSMDRTL